MGVRARQKPKRLAEKLREIRTGLGLSQNGMIRLLGAELTQNRISEYELGIGEPSLLILLQYARVAGIHMEDIVDDEVNLPSYLPSKRKHRR